MANWEIVIYGLTPSDMFFDTPEHIIAQWHEESCTKEEIFALVEAEIEDIGEDRVADWTMTEVSDERMS